MLLTVDASFAKPCFMYYPCFVAVVMPEVLLLLSCPLQWLHNYVTEREIIIIFSLALDTLKFEFSGNDYRRSVFID